MKHLIDIDVDISELGIDSIIPTGKQLRIKSGLDQLSLAGVGN